MGICTAWLIVLEYNNSMSEILDSQLAELPHHEFLSTVYPVRVPPPQSRYVQHVVEVLGTNIRNPKIIDRLMRGQVATSDAAAESIFESSEHMGNAIFDTILRDPSAVDRENVPLHDVFEDHIDHGYSHLRRVEKWYKLIQHEDHAGRLDEAYQRFSLSAFLAIKTHDLVYLGSHIKEHHAQAGALFMLGYLLDHYDELAVNSEHGIQMNHTEWEKVAWGTAFIIAHHTKPETIRADIVDTGPIEGILDPGELLTTVEAYCASNGLSISDYFPPYNSIISTLGKVTNGTLTAPRFTQQEIQGLVKQAKFMAVADKLDTTYPPELVVPRTLETKPERPFFLPLSDYYLMEIANKQGNEYDPVSSAQLQSRDPHLALKHFARSKLGLNIDPDTMSPQQLIDCEIAVRGWFAAEGIALCDMDRFLFELARSDMFHGVSAFVSRFIPDVQRKKASFLRNAVERFVNGDPTAFSSGFANRAMIDRAAFFNSLPLEVRGGQIAQQSIDECVRPFALEGEKVTDIAYRKLDWMAAHPTLSSQRLMRVGGKLIVLPGVSEQWRRHIVELIDRATAPMLKKKHDAKIAPPYMTYCPPHTSYLAIKHG